MKFYSPIGSPDGRMAHDRSILTDQSLLVIDKLIDGCFVGSFSWCFYLPRVSLVGGFMVLFAM